MRIVFKEKERQKQIENGEAQLVDLEKTFSENTDILIAELNKSMQEYTNEIRNIKKQISVIKRENQLAMNNTLFVIMGVVLGVILTFVYQWII